MNKAAKIAIFLPLALLVLYFLYNNRQPEIKRIENQVTYALPLGSSKEEVVFWLDKQGWPYTYREKDKSRSYRDVIYVGLKGVGNKWFVEGTGHIEFVFDKKGKLERRIFGQTFIGP